MDERTIHIQNLPKDATIIELYKFFRGIYLYNIKIQICMYDLLASLVIGVPGVSTPYYMMLL